MSTTAGNVLSRLNEKLNDADNVRWPEAEHFRAMSDAQQAILESRPDLFEVYANVATVAGVVQTVPSDCYRLFDIVANLSSTNVPTGGITKVDRARMDRHRLNWMLLTASAIADHWMQDDREQGVFYLVPGQPTANRGKLQIRYAQRPSAITASGNTLSLDDEGINAIYNFCMHRALEKDEKFAGSPTAQSYMTKFAQFLGVKSEADNQFAARREKSEKS